MATKKLPKKTVKKIAKKLSYRDLFTPLLPLVVVAAGFTIIVIFGR
jgi:hypothetical protein